MTYAAIVALGGLVVPAAQVHEQALQQEGGAAADGIAAVLFHFFQELLAAGGRRAGLPARGGGREAVALAKAKKHRR